jgi:tetratricopeptide (TPR) repeat protein
LAEGFLTVKDFRLLDISAAAILVLALLNACTDSQISQKPDEAYVQARALPESRSFSGSYLAGRMAQRIQDWDAAQNYMNDVLTYDSANEQLLQKTFLLTLGAGQYTKARELAEKIAADPADTEIALIYLACDALKRGDFTAASTYTQKLPNEGFGQYTKPLLDAWTLAGQGKKEEAIARLEKSAGPDDPTYHVHVGLIQELFGDMNAAADHYKLAMENGLTLHTALLVANFFDRYGQPEVPQTIYSGLGKVYPLSSLSGSGGAGNRIVRPNITEAHQGAGYALFDLASLLYERRAFDSAQIYTSIVQMLTPDAPFVLLMAGDIAALQNQYPKAIANYNSITGDSPLFWLAQMRVAEVYEVDSHPEKTVALLTSLARNPETHLQAMVSLGDLYRRQEKFDLALAAYDEALADVEKVTVDHWPIIYARGMSLERLNDWSRAEKDLLKALEFQPDNPMILNFIGYSWANQGVNLDKALDYTRRAAAMRPDDGYILDSYGWALYRNGQFGQALELMEKAVDQVPGDSTILDHLGDAYWQTGRKQEAQFQWQRAHDLSKDALFKTSVLQKLKNGIKTIPSQVAHNDPKL